MNLMWRARTESVGGSRTPCSVLDRSMLAAAAIAPISNFLAAALALCVAPQAQQAPPPPDPDEAMKQDRPGTEPEPETDGPFAQQPGFSLLPKTPPTMMPYLATVNLYGDSCTQAGALITGDPLSNAAQIVKTALAQYGVNYAIWQSYNFVAMSGTLGNTKDVLNYYSFNSFLTWNIFQTDELGGSAGWLTVGGSAGTGLGYDGDKQTAQGNMGTLGFPLGTDVGQSAYLYQLAWQQSFMAGQVVVTVGLLDPEMYLDLNTYANNQYNQLINYEFINPAVLPWSYNAMGVVVQWQPVNWFYAMFASAANNTPVGESPVQGISSDDWTNTFEFGLIGEDVCGLGPGTIRVLPFFGTTHGETGAGFMVNLEQKLGKETALGMFARAGFTNDALGAVQGAKSSFATGLVLNGPSESELLKTQQAYFAGGFYWLESPYANSIHENEYGLELTYVLQLTETLTLQPDIQVILDPAKNPNTDSAVMFTMQLVYTW